MKNSMEFPKIVKLVLPYSLTIPLLCIYLKELKDTLTFCTLMFLETLFIIAKIGKQPNVSSVVG